MTPSYMTPAFVYFSGKLLEKLDYWLPPLITKQNQNNSWTSVLQLHSCCDSPNLSPASIFLLPRQLDSQATSCKHWFPCLKLDNSPPQLDQILPLSPDLYNLDPTCLPVFTFVMPPVITRNFHFSHNFTIAKMAVSSNSSKPLFASSMLYSQNNLSRLTIWHNLTCPARDSWKVMCLGTEFLGLSPFLGFSVLFILLTPYI